MEAVHDSHPLAGRSARLRRAKTDFGKGDLGRTANLNEAANFRLGRSQQPKRDLVLQAQRTVGNRAAAKMVEGLAEGSAERAGPHIDATSIAARSRREHLLVSRQEFKQESKDRVEHTYTVEVRPLPGGLGCMRAFYQGLDAAYGDDTGTETRKHLYKGSIAYGRKRAKKKGIPKPTRKKLEELSKSQRTVRQVMAFMVESGKAGSSTSFRFDKSKKIYSPDPEAFVLSASTGPIPGWWFFGVATGGAYHTVMLMVDRSSPSPVIHWLDQHGPQDVTGRLSESLHAGKYKHKPVTIWPLIAPPETGVSVSP